nr:hypothetical protein [Tanacetum cinerariifolium]
MVVKETKFSIETKVAKEVTIISSSDDEILSDDAVSSDEELTSHEVSSDDEVSSAEDISEYYFSMQKASNSKVYTSSASEASASKVSTSSSSKSKAFTSKMEGKGLGGSKQNLAKKQDASIAKGELGNEIKRIMLEYLPTILAQKEQERKRKAEQDMKNAEDAERRRNEEDERQTNAEAQRDGCSYKSFMNCKPSEFYGDSNPVIVTKWLREIEDIFEISECSPRQRVKYAFHLLKGEARHW